VKSLYKKIKALMVGAKEIRNLISTALDDDQFQNLCQDDFPQVFDKFTTGQSKDQRVRTLVEFVVKQREIPRLLAAIQDLNPNAYAAFVAEHGDPLAASPATPLAAQPTPPQIVSIIPERVQITTCDVLVLVANPTGTVPLQLEKETELIKARLAEGEIGKGYVVQSVPVARAEDLSQYLLMYRPRVVHFAGHGHENGELIFTNAQNQSQPISAAALAGLFAVIGWRVECVVLNACFSFEKADELREQVDCVIGMNDAILDGSALRFAAGFYRGIGFGFGYRRAFDLGCNEIQLLNLPDHQTPRFVSARLEIEPVEQKRLETVEPTRSGTPRSGQAEAIWYPLGQAKATRYPLWFGTNRKPIDPSNISKGFSGERDQQLRFGTCQVTVPKSHKIGSIGSPWWQRLLTQTDDSLKLVQDSMMEWQSQAFWTNIQQALQDHDPSERMGLVFIHGFNVSFEAAALRAAQIGVDLQVPGVTAFYSWPSKGKLAGYPADEDSIRASEAYITEFLVNFVKHSGAKQVHLIAHSMGNRGLLRSIQRIAQQAQEQSQIRFGQIFLAAPDEDPDVFGDLAIAFQQVAQRTTLYISAKDKALASSGLIHNVPRAGFSPPITIVPGVDTVEVSKIDLTLLGHGYYGDARPVLQDMYSLIRQNTEPGERFGLNEVVLEQQKRYWTFVG
jgi:esterase/lipase superfamily enzyme